MKLKNKLLPLVGISAACAAVAPIALTSCTTSDLVDLTQVYYAQYDADPVIETMTQAEGEDHYFNACQAAPGLIQDDYYWFTARTNTTYLVASAAEQKAEAAKAATEELLAAAVADGKVLVEDANGLVDVAAVNSVTDLKRVVSEAAAASSDVYAGSVSVDNRKISDFSVSKVAYDYGETEINTWAMSFKMEFEVQGKYANYQEGDQLAKASKEVYGIGYDSTYKGTIEFHNIPVRMYPNTLSAEYFTNLWFVRTAGSYLIDAVMAKPANNSYMKFNVNVESTSGNAEAGSRYRNTTYNFTVDKDYTATEAWDDYSEMMQIVSTLYASHYMWNKRYDGHRR